MGLFLHGHPVHGLLARNSLWGRYAAYSCVCMWVFFRYLASHILYSWLTMHLLEGSHRAFDLLRSLIAKQSFDVSFPGLKIG